MSTALVRAAPYIYRLSGKRRMANLYRYRTAASVLRTMLANRKAFVGTARTAKKMLAFSRQKYHKSRFSRARIGERRGSGTSKRTTTDETAVTAQATRTLYVNNISDIAQGADLNNRERATAFVSGFKICMEVRNRTPSPLYFHYAVLSPKQGTTVDSTDFFRKKEGSTRSRNFDNNCSSIEFNCLPINTDKYNILCHKKKLLVAQASGGLTVSLTGKSYSMIDEWVGLKRQLRWNDATATDSYDRIFLVHWADEMFVDSAVTPFANAYDLSKKVVCYFRDPRGA